MSTVWTETRSIPVIEEYDVCVVGGGVAGVAAALAAAREGAKTCLIEKEYALGGLATLGLIVIYLPLCDGRGRQVISGISEELLKASIKYAPGNLPACWQSAEGDPEARKAARYRTNFEAAPFMIALEELLLDAGVTLMYDSRFCGVHRTGRHIDGVIVENKSGRMGVGARMVVDATGDADVCFAAGEKTGGPPLLRGRPARRRDPARHRRTAHDYGRRDEAARRGGSGAVSAAHSHLRRDAHDPPAVRRL